jgi:pyruvate,water dikinase
LVCKPADAGDVTGKVLVAEMTDPGWVFLMASAAALVVEKGSLLSHTAIIGRELGVPTVVGVEGATELIRSGQLVQVNGQTGDVCLQSECSQ